MGEIDYEALKNDIRRKILAELPIDFFEVNDDFAIREKISKLCRKFLPWNLKKEADTLVKDLLYEFLGFGPIEPLIADPLITEIMINAPDRVFVEKEGRIEKANIRFRNAEQLMYYVEKILTPVGKTVSEAEPYVSAQLKDGSRVNVVIPPISGQSPVITIRKFWENIWNLNDLEKMGTLNSSVRKFLEHTVIGKRNIIVCGGAGTGKTTLLNALARHIPNEERVIVLEEVSEIRLYQENSVHLTTKLANPEGKGEITLRHLIKNALHMRPDRLIIGEIRGEEVLDVLQAMNTGHEGSMCTIHANSAEEAVYRLETLSFLSGIANMSSDVVKRIIGAAVDVLIFMRRYKNGKRKIVQVSEVVMEDGELAVKDIFVREDRDSDLIPTGYRPTFGFRVETE